MKGKINHIWKKGRVFFYGFAIRHNFITGEYVGCGDKGSEYEKLYD